MPGLQGEGCKETEARKKAARSQELGAMERAARSTKAAKRGLQGDRSKGEGCGSARAARSGLRGAKRKGEGCEEHENLLRRRKAETGGLLPKLRKRKSGGVRREAVLERQRRGGAIRFSLNNKERALEATARQR